MAIFIVALFAIYASLKWMTWRFNCQAVLLYYAESGCDLPDGATIRKYRLKVIQKTFGSK
jgi:hypothetical protein